MFSEEEGGLAVEQDDRNWTAGKEVIFLGDWCHYPCYSLTGIQFILPLGPQMTQVKRVVGGCQWQEGIIKLRYKNTIQQNK